jgi:hypothetical protein
MTRLSLAAISPYWPPGRQKRVCLMPYRKFRDAIGAHGPQKYRQHRRRPCGIVVARSNPNVLTLQYPVALQINRKRCKDPMFQ